jgi:hypothetical protein
MQLHRRAWRLAGRLQLLSLVLWLGMTATWAVIALASR